MAMTAKAQSEIDLAREAQERRIARVRLKLAELKESVAFLEEKLDEGNSAGVMSEAEHLQNRAVRVLTMAARWFYEEGR